MESEWMKRKKDLETEKVSHSSFFVEGYFFYLLISSRKKSKINRESRGFINVNVHWSGRFRIKMVDDPIEINSNRKTGLFAPCNRGDYANSAACKN